jgi:hypothetical protein
MAWNADSQGLKALQSIPPAAILRDRFMHAFRGEGVQEMEAENRRWPFSQE